MCICQYQSPSLFFSPVTTKFVFYIYDSISVLWSNSFVHFIFRFQVLSDNVYLPFSVWLTSFNMTISRSIHVAKNDIIQCFICFSKVFVHWMKSRLCFHSFFPLLFVIETYRERFVNILSQYMYWSCNHGPLTDLVIFESIQSWRHTKTHDHISWEPL